MVSLRDVAGRGVDVGQEQALHAGRLDPELAAQMEEARIRRLELDKPRVGLARVSARVLDVVRFSAAIRFALVARWSRRATACAGWPRA